MVQRTTIVLIDDLDNEITDDVESITFAYQGESFEIDLGADHREALAAALAPYLAAGRKTRRDTAAKPRRRGAAAGSSDTASIRAWAAANGVEVSSRGRIPAAVREQYEAAQA